MVGAASRREPLWVVGTSAAFVAVVVAVAGPVQGARRVGECGREERTGAVGRRFDGRPCGAGRRIPLGQVDEVGVIALLQHIAQSAVSIFRRSQCQCSEREEEDPPACLRK